jgi:acetyl-CoA C-acetyltransferase
VAPDDVDHVVFGHVIPTETHDAYLARVAAVNAGLPVKVPAVTVNRLCGTGLQAIVDAAQLILLGDADCTVAGGSESMSRGAYLAENHRWGQRMGNSELVDSVTGALADPFDDHPMGITAENVAEKWGVPREEQDALAVESHRRAAHATAGGYFKEQILPIEVKTRKGTTVVEHDEHIRGDADLDSMAKLRPIFKKNGTVTAGNASSMNDGASAVVMMDRAVAERRGLSPMARLVGYSYAGVDPKYMGIGPVPAVKSLLERTGLTSTTGCDRTERGVRRPGDRGHA